MTLPKIILSKLIKLLRFDFITPWRSLHRNRNRFDDKKQMRLYLGLSGYGKFRLKYLGEKLTGYGIYKKFGDIEHQSCHI